MTADPLVLVDDLDTATERLLASAARLDDAAVAAASRLPGWTRGHVLAHIARNADGATNLLTWARTGIETPQYASAEQRVIDIEAGAGRSAAAQLADLTASAARLTEAVGLMPPTAWSAQVRWTSGESGPAALVIWRRLREVELHHVDLLAGYEPKDWPEAFTVRMATALARDFGARPDGPRVVLRCPEVGHDLPLGAGPTAVVEGPAWAVVAWLTGRSSGDGLGVEPAGPLPSVPPFG